MSDRVKNQETNDNTATGNSNPTNVGRTGSLNNSPGRISINFNKGPTSKQKSTSSQPSKLPPNDTSEIDALRHASQAKEQKRISNAIKEEQFLNSDPSTDLLDPDAQPPDVSKSDPMSTTPLLPSNNPSDHIMDIKDGKRTVKQLRDEGILRTKKAAKFKQQLEEQIEQTSAGHALLQDEKDGYGSQPTNGHATTTTTTTPSTIPTGSSTSTSDAKKDAKQSTEPVEIDWEDFLNGRAKNIDQAREFYGYLSDPKNKFLFSKDKPISKLDAARITLAFKKYLDFEADMAYMDRREKKSFCYRFTQFWAQVAAAYAVSLEPFFAYFLATEGVSPAIAEWANFANIKSSADPNWATNLGGAVGAGVNMLSDVSATIFTDEAQDLINSFEHPETDPDKRTIKGEYQRLKYCIAGFNALVSFPVFASLALPEIPGAFKLFQPTTLGGAIGAGLFATVGGEVYYYMFCSRQLFNHPNKVIDYLAAIVKAIEEGKLSEKSPNWNQVPAIIEVLLRTIIATTQRATVNLTGLSVFCDDILQIAKDKGPEVFLSMEVIAFLTVWNVLWTRTDQVKEEYFSEAFARLTPEEIAEGARHVTWKGRLWDTAITLSRAIPAWFLVDMYASDDPATSAGIATGVGLGLGILQALALHYKRVRDNAIEQPGYKERIAKEDAEKEAKKAKVKNIDEKLVDKPREDQLSKKHYTELSKELNTPRLKSSAWFLTDAARVVRLGGFQGYLTGLMETLVEYNINAPKLDFKTKALLTGLLGIPVALAEKRIFGELVEAAFAYYRTLLWVGAPESSKRPWLGRLFGKLFVSSSEFELEELRKATTGPF